jgi:hypothetical protein
VGSAARLPRVRASFSARHLRYSPATFFSHGFLADSQRLRFGGLRSVHLLVVISDHLLRILFLASFGTPQPPLLAKLPGLVFIEIISDFAFIQFGSDFDHG